MTPGRGGTGRRRAGGVARDPYRERGRGYRLREADALDLVPRFLIVCEGARTEPNYFRQFRVPKEVRDAMRVHGSGYNTLSLVEEAVRLRDAEGPFTQVWCVFDRDSFSARQFNAALQLAEREGFHVAYSNEAFELWYILHYHYLDTGISRADYNARLTRELMAEFGCPYRKDDRAMYDRLYPRQAEAIRRARRLLATYDPPRPERDKPSTTVHLLVEELNRHIDP